MYPPAGLAAAVLGAASQTITSVIVPAAFMVNSKDVTGRCGKLY
jgi:hypothetical protein